MRYPTSASPFRSSRSLFLILSFTLGFFTHLHAQEEVIPLLHGQVRVGDEPLAGAMVVLHEVSSIVSGEIDSIQTNMDGTFELILPRLPAHGVRSEVFFASVRYRDLLYLGAAITSPIQLDSLYSIQAFDTLSVPALGASLPVSVRNLFLEKVEGGWNITDLFELLQSEDRTLYSPTDGVVWSYPLPALAQDFEVAQGDQVAETVILQNGHLEVYSPLPPGERFFLLHYHVPDDAFTLPLPGSTMRLEIMVAESTPQMDLTPLRPADPVELEPGNVFGRWEGTELTDTEIRVQVMDEPFRFRAEWLGILLAALLGGAGVFAYRLKGTNYADEPGASGSNTQLSREELLLALARLDEEYQDGGERTPAELEEYQTRRAELLRDLEQLG